MCKTVPVGAISRENKKLLQVTRDCLYKSIQEVREGAYLNDIARVIETIANRHGYGVVEDLVGHGVGYYAHEEPNVPHFTIPEDSSENIELKAGMIICIEPMINEGTWEVDVAPNEYTIVSADKSMSAHFEHTILVKKDGFEILTEKHDE
jgi:methionyl aminopeptidase